MVKEITSGGSLLFGNGLGFVTTEKWKSVSAYYKLIGVESIILIRMLETGVVGLISFFLFYFGLGRSFKNASVTLGGNPHKYMGIVFVICYMLSLLFTGDRGTMPVFLTLLMIYIKTASNKSTSKSDNISNIIHREIVKKKMVTY